MDRLFQQALQQAAALKNRPDSIPWNPDEPWTQPSYTWIDEHKQWEPAPSSNHGTQSASISKIALYSWNIDFMLPFPETRMNAALAHLRGLTRESLSTPDTAVVIHLQECTPSDLITISQTQWIRDSFSLTDIDPSNWASGLYGTTTLIDRRLSISSCFRVHFSQTRMERDALFVDISLPSMPGPDTHRNKNKKFRLCTTHLESLAMDPPLRPAQMQLIASHMHADGISGAVVMGDFNAIQPFDLSLHVDNGLKDAYLELGGQEGSEEGYTWGQQALPVQREQFGCSRMDKAFFCGVGLRLMEFERLGGGVVIPEEEGGQKERILGLGFERAWVTDHLGVRVVFVVKDEGRL
ncbi:hypothetical protein N8T08_004694 [Aspergillus melleus]|uniref:Uncharacterized protein n=1 Tax=Aspergillus melleus TaxID=138277 RepID=A0ACC3B3X6_9EURO|nr:hypothetical protein N8T08_004694 [Aspergillus melleus]